jgi:GT2 family glycosyltransferase/ubiquinone/menaquinone biosynthesis C-methylase UbiE/ADP-heptose:LPS heptosyltransferase
MIFDRLNEKYYRQIVNKDAQDNTRKRIHWICSQPEGTNLLDIGCSQGIVPILLGREGFYCTGVDIMQQSIDYANNELNREEDDVRKRVHFQKMDALSLDFEDSTFDTVFLTEVIEHLVHPEKAISEARRVLKPNGKFVLTVPYGYNKSIDHKNYYFLADIFMLLSSYFSPKELFSEDRYIYFTSYKSNIQISNEEEIKLLKKYIILDNKFLLQQDMRLFHEADVYHSKINEAQNILTELQNDLRIKNTIIKKYEQERKEFFSLINEKLGERIIEQKNDVSLQEKVDNEAHLVSKATPFITFGIFTYNRAHLIQEAIESIFAQGVENYEIIVVDDGSTDNTEEVVKSIGSDKIRYIRKDHSGAPDTRNRIIEEAKGDYICWIGDDDKLEPNVIKEYYKILEHNDPDVIYGDIQQYDDETGEDLHLYAAPDYSESSNDFIKKIISGVGLTDGGSLIKKSIYEKFGKYDTEFQRTQDLEFWSRIATSAKFYKNDRVVYKCRKHGRHLSSGDIHDRSYESLINKKILNKHPLKEIYWDYDWSNEHNARVAAFKEIARGFMLTSDYYNADKIFRKAGFNHTDDELLGWWFNCLLGMGNEERMEDFLKKLNNINPALYQKFTSIYQVFKNDIDLLDTAYNQPEKIDHKKITEIVNKYSFSQRVLLFLARNFEILKNYEEVHKYYMLALQCDASNESVYQKALSSALDDIGRLEVKKKRERLLRDLPLYDELNEEPVITSTEPEIIEKSKAEESVITSIVICAYNNLPFTKACIESIYDKTNIDLFEIIAVDNGSSDGTKEYFKKLCDEENNFKALFNKENLGFAKGCNQGIKSSTGKYILLLNNDTIALDGWLENMTRELDQDENTGVVGACLLYPDGKLIQHLWVTIGNQNNYIAPYHEYSFYNINEVPEVSRSREVSAVTGACMLIRRSILEKTGLLDENYLNSFEDIDFCFRVTEAGYKIKYAGKSRLIHHESTTKSRHDNDVKNWQRLNQNWLGKIKFDESHQETLRKNAEIDRRREMALVSQQTIENAAPEQLVEPEIDFSIIIPVHNNLNFTKQLLNGIAKTRGLFGIEIIVVDNASTDGTDKYILSLGRNVYLIKNDKNETYAHSNNQGAAIAKGKFLIFLNNDTIPFPGWLEAMATEFEDNDNTGVQGAKLLYENGTIQHAGMIFGSRPGRQEEPYHAYLTADPSMPFVNKRRKVQFVTGACLAIRKDIFEKINGFDEGYVFGWEDTDLCMKVNNQGYEVIYNPGAVLYHFESTTKRVVTDAGYDVLNPDTPREAANRERFFKKWKNAVIKDDESFYLEDGFKLKDHTLIQIQKIVEQQEIKFTDKEKKEYKTSFSPENWKRDYDKITTVLFKCEPAVGDSLTMTAVIRNLKAKHPHLVIYVSGNELTGDIFEYNEDIEDFALSGSEDEFNLEAMTDLVIDYNRLLGQYIDYYNNLPYMDIIANIAGVKLKNKGIVYHVSQEESDWANGIMAGLRKSGKVIGVQFHTNKDIKRCYPYGNELINYMKEQDPELSFVNLGTEPLEISDDYIFDAAKNEIDLRHQIALCEHCDAFLTIDSAFFHVGHNLFNKPTLVITGVTNPKLIGNPEAGFEYIRKESLDCLNCYWQKKCNIECMKQLMPKEVGEKMLGMV